MNRHGPVSESDILERLYRATPYGLEDYTVLRDAREEITRLRRLLTELETKP